MCFLDYVLNRILFGVLRRFVCGNGHKLRSTFGEGGGSDDCPKRVDNTLGNLHRLCPTFGGGRKVFLEKSDSTYEPFYKVTTMLMMILIFTG